MGVKTIKNVRPEVWKKFKNLAEEEKMPMGLFLERLITSHEQRVKDQWNKIFSWKSTTTEKEAKEMLKEVAKLRSEWGWRT